MPRKIDRRVRRTRKMLGEALLALIIEQPYETITIQEITERADLNRATFYLHYANKEELLVASLEARFDELVERLEKSSIDRPIWQDKTTPLLTFQHAAENAPLYKVLLGQHGMGYIVHRIINYIASFNQERIRASLPTDEPLLLPTEIVAHHLAGSIFALLSWWVTHDMPHSAEYMADAVHTLCTQGTLAGMTPGSGAKMVDAGKKKALTPG